MKALLHQRREKSLYLLKFPKDVLPRAKVFGLSNKLLLVKGFFCYLKYDFFVAHAEIVDDLEADVDVLEAIQGY